MPEEITDILTSTPVKLTVMFLIVSAVMIYIASLYWVYQDINRRTKNPVIQGISIAVSLLPYFGVIIYLFIRPPMTILERKIQKLDALILRKIAQGELPLSAYQEIGSPAVARKREILQQRIDQKNLPEKTTITKAHHSTHSHSEKNSNKDETKNSNHISKKNSSTHPKPHDKKKKN